MLDPQRLDRIDPQGPEGRQHGCQSRDHDRAPLGDEPLHQLLLVVPQLVGDLSGNTVVIGRSTHTRRPCVAELAGCGTALTASARGAPEARRRAR